MSGEPLSEFQEGQWWVNELDSMAKTGTDDQKRAVAVVHNLLRTAASAPTMSNASVVAWENPSTHAILRDESPDMSNLRRREWRALVYCATAPTMSMFIKSRRGREEMTPEEIDRIAELHLVADDDGCIYGTEAFAAAIEAATIERCAVELKRHGWDESAAFIRALATKEGS